MLKILFIFICVSFNTVNGFSVNEDIQYNLVVKFKENYLLKIKPYSKNYYSYNYKNTEIKFSHILGSKKIEWDNFLLKTHKQNLNIKNTEFNFFNVQVADKRKSNLLNIKSELENLDFVEFAYIQPLYVPPPEDIAPTTEYFVEKQKYYGDFPGHNFDYAWEKNAKGLGVQLSIWVMSL